VMKLQKRSVYAKLYAYYSYRSTPELNAPMSPSNKLQICAFCVHVVYAFWNKQDEEG
jgi:hypothetical protein